MVNKNSKKQSSSKRNLFTPLYLEYADSNTIMEMTGERNKKYIRKVLYRYNHYERIVSARGKAIIAAAKELPVNKPSVP